MFASPTKIKILNKQLRKRRDLLFKRYLPRFFYPTLLPSWISFSSLNYLIPQIDQDKVLLKTKLKNLDPMGPIKDSDILKQAFKEKWLYYRMISKGQLNPHEPLKERRQIKFLILKIDISYFKGQKSSIRLLHLLAIGEFFYKSYKNVRVVIQCFDSFQTTGSSAFKNFDLKFKAFFLYKTSYSFLQYISQLRKLLEILRTKT